MTDKAKPVQAVPDLPKRGRGNPMWVKGQSGNPTGKPAGARNKLTTEAKIYLESKALEIVKKLVERAKAGDMKAIQLCMERLIPKVEIHGTADGNEALRQALAGSDTISAVEQDKFRVVR